jgi:class 3 adenylate cyclase
MRAVIEQPRVERRLAAILAADVVGFGELMDNDEIGTLRRFKDHLNALIYPLVAAYGGRLVKLTGDGLLAEFRSVVDAVSCAIAIQRGIETRNADAASQPPMVFRIGINIGDIIVDGSDIYGNGVNVAARLEALSDSGGLCLSGAAIDQINETLPVVFTDRGEQYVKNVSRPIRVYALSAAAIAELAKIPGALPSPAGLAAKAQPRMSIVVLPFVNFSSDPEQGFFADGRRALRKQALGPHILDHIALGRSYFHRPYSVFHGQEAKRHFQAALDVDSDALEAMAGLAMVISRDLANGWSKQPEEDISLTEELVDAGLAMDTGNPDFYYARGMLFRRLGRIDDGIASFQTGLEIDPNHYLCLSGIAFLNYFGGNPEHALALTENLFRVSPRDPNLANLHWVRGSCHVHLREPETAITHLLRARRQNNQLWFIHYTLAAAYALNGALDNARRSLADMQRLKPEYTSIAQVQRDLPYLEDPRYVAKAEETTHRGLQMAGLPLR